MSLMVHNVRYAANTIRRINMELWDTGFAANRGLTNLLLCHPDCFVWAFENTVQRDLAMEALESARGSCSMPKMKIKGRKSSSRKVRFTRLKPALREKWQCLKSQATDPGLESHSSCKLKKYVK